MDFDYKQLEDGSVKITSLLLLEDVRLELKVDYIISFDGMIKMEMHFAPGIKGLPNLPRFGFSFAMKNTPLLEYYGRGPHENYCDRNTSAFVGLYADSVKNQFFNYARPQENGYKTDARWLKVFNENSAVIIGSDKLFSFSTLDVPTSELDQLTKYNYQHINDVNHTNTTFVHIDMKQMGVGGDNSWGAWPHEQYRIPAREYNFKCVLFIGDKNIYGIDIRHKAETKLN